jgi:hypothetical protein
MIFKIPIQQRFICRHSESTVSEDAGIETHAGLLQTFAMAVRRSNHSCNMVPIQ